MSEDKMVLNRAAFFGEVDMDVEHIVLETVAEEENYPFVMSATGYDSLASVLKDAFDQASTGKGKERHANDLPFDEQPMQSISNLLDSTDGMEFQVIKKIKEAKSLPTLAQKERELLGAIVYTAGIIIKLRRDEDLLHG